MEIAQAACDKQRRSKTLPLRILPLRRFPATLKTPRDFRSRMHEQTIEKFASIQGDSKKIPLDRHP
jgi:hypothetical protein